MRAGGPGGQHVNTTSTAVQLRFDVRRSPSLPDDVRRRLEQLAGSRLTSDGVLVLHAQGHRSQLRNREEALARLVALVRAAARPPAPRQAHASRAGQQAPPGGRQEKARRAQGAAGAAVARLGSPVVLSFMFLSP